MSPAIGPYAPSRRAGEWVVTSGQIGVAPGADGTAALVGPDVESQLRQALANLAEVLGDQGLGLADVVKATVFVVDVGALATVNGIWTSTFGDEPPARSAVGVAALPLGAVVEVEAWAFRPER
ncbi:MAG TPA: Rid family hydrolase [Acidimicrobiales bacterium]|jgi:2-iminobutanoate/2-iminopropanoate deaminase